MKRFALHSHRVVTTSGVIEATVIISDEKIEQVFPGFLRNPDLSVEDLKDAVIMPGLIDSHVHINEPGRTEWEGFNTATQAAAAGGITTLIDMPLNSSPVTTNTKALALKIESAKKALHVNCGFYGGIIPGNFSDLESLMQAGVFGIKAFLTHSGIDEFPNVTEQHLRQAMPILKKHNMPLLVHAELDEPHSDQIFLEQNPINYFAYLKSRPKSWEDKAINLMIDLCKGFNTPVHIVHLSSSNSINPLKQAIASGLPISTETCPHYLFFNAEGIPDGGTQYKCAPPIREKENNEQLWDALRQEVISFIVTDHSPAPPEIKELQSGDFKKAWGGIAGLQFSLPVVWTKAKEKGFTMEDISNLMSRNIARFLELEKKGKIAEGCDADLVIWNPEKEFVVTRDSIEHRHKITPYEGLLLSGVVERTYVGGHNVFENGKFNLLNKGKVITRKQ